MKPRRKRKFKNREEFQKYVAKLALASIKEDGMNDQRSTLDQLKDLYDLANKNGLYDAADWLSDQMVKNWPEYWIGRGRPNNPTAERMSQLAGVKK